MSGTPTVLLLGDGEFAGRPSSISEYSVSEDATPLSLHSLTGGVTGITFRAAEDDSPTGSVMLRGEKFRLTDPFAGRQIGLVDATESVGLGLLTVQASGLLIRSVCTRKAAAYTGNVQGAIEYYLGLCGLGAMPLSIDGSIAIINCDLPAWEGEVWAQLKKLAVIKNFDISEVDGVCVVRPRRSRWMDFTSRTGVRMSTHAPEAASAVQVYYYNSVWRTDYQVYPKIGTLTPDVNILQVDASETFRTNIPVDMWIKTINSPTQVTHLAQTEDPAGSVFAVVDKDGKAVQPQDWANAGGSFKVARGADGKSIDITIVGASTTARSPYRIASSSDDGTYQYSALYLVATGQSFNKEMIEGNTGAGTELASIDEVVVIDDPMVDTLTDAVRVLDAAATRLAGHGQNIVVDATRVNRRGETGVIIGPTFSEFDAMYAGMTFSEFDAAYAGTTFRTFDAAMNASKADDFENQAFGSVSGARVRYRDSIYRVTSSSTNPGPRFTWTAEFDTLFSDFDSAWAGATFGEFDAQWAGYTFRQHAASPLWRT